ncbi:MAG: GGDEF domain-containing protein [Bradyrhizobiaceae bacterium]|nr:MAG: GGDEF domain-containing protein [Bradyrhizobiaceae bacterium]
MWGAVFPLKLMDQLSSADAPASDVLPRRAVQRRQIQTIMALSYLTDTAVLALYALAGTTSLTTPPVFLVCALLSVTCFVLLSDAHFNDRFKDHYLVLQQMGVSFLLMLSFIYIVPEVGCVFLCSLFVIVALGSLRSTMLQIGIAWGVLTAGLAWLFLLTTIPISMPHGTFAERFATLFLFVVTIGRCMMVGMFSSALRESFYTQGLALKEAYRRIEELAEFDELTGAHNRRSIMHALVEESERAIRTKSPCSIALIDLDFFKKINDLYGHPVGDEVLRTFAITMFANVRAIDKFGRYGGEEFLLIMPETAEDTAEKVADRLRMIIADIDWNSISPGIAVTMSAGVATLRHDETPENLLLRADMALYRAKDRGRNRIEHA